MSYEDKKNIAGETEMLGSDEQNVSRLLSDLKRVDAPKPSNSQSSFECSRQICGRVA